MPDPVPPAKLQVFLCHSSGDNEEIRKIYELLKAEPWIHPWLDEEDLIPGQEWRDEIEKAVEESHVILVCMSPASITKEGFVQREIRVALDHADYMPEGRIYIIPLKLKPIEDEKLPRRLRRWQWVNYFEGRGHERLMRGLRRQAKDLGIEYTSTPVVPVSTLSVEPPQPQPALLKTPSSSNERYRQQLVGLIEAAYERLTELEKLIGLASNPIECDRFIFERDKQRIEVKRLETILADLDNLAFPTPAKSPNSPSPSPSAPVQAPIITPVRQSVTPSPATKPVETEQERLLRELDDLKTTHKRRLEIGERLNEIGDTRRGVGVREDGIPDIVWLPVTPGGQITLTIDDKEQAFDVPPFYIAKYLITYAQYEAFVKAKDGFNNPEWWRDFPKEYQKQPLNIRHTKLGNHPRNNLTWYQSVAFTRWLNRRLGGWQLPHPDLAGGSTLVIGQSAEIRLPLEWEWQWAAQNGHEARTYPWGNWKDGYANTFEAGLLGQTTAVGMYPQGGAACGALDLSGNLDELCWNKYSKSHEERALRGGSFYSFAKDVDCASRSHFPVSQFINDYTSIGFRVVVSSPIAPSDL